MFRINLKDSEIVSKSESVFSFNGQEQKVSSELIEIKRSADNISEKDAFCNFKIIK